MRGNVIFLDIDGVLNSSEFFNIEYKKEYYYFGNDIDLILYNNYLNELDFNKVYMIRNFANSNDCDIVITSTWKNKKNYHLLENYLISIGLPIVGSTNNCDYNRTLEISDYLSNHNYYNYIIIDDYFYDGYDKFYEHLIHTTYSTGIGEEDLKYGELLLKGKIR